MNWIASIIWRQIGRHVDKMESIKLGYGYISPCKGCEKRTVGCHSTCEAYIESKAKYEAIAEPIRKENILQNEAVGYAIKRQDNTIKKRRGGWRGKK